MAAQNIYDDPDFLAGYATLDRQAHGLAGAAEWPTFRSMLADVAGKAVVDLGCGFGWLSRWAAENGAEAVLGLDISQQMLARARSETTSSIVDYRCVDLDSVDLDPQSADLFVSSLALHYVRDLDELLGNVASAARPGGSLVFSVEHPIFSAPTTQEFETSRHGHRIWPLDRYHVEGERVRNWFVAGVVKQHRTVATYVNAVIGAGFTIDRLVEWGPTPEAIAHRPELADDLDRPWFLLVRATALR